LSLTCATHQRADRVIAMGGYNTMCEVLSFEKARADRAARESEAEQWIRANVCRTWV